ncbi:MAG: TetR/AcrR family transcriptional regulator [Pseudomonadota bacterium]
MARPRSFNDDDIRAKLLLSFWETGFEGTALPDLEAATGMSRKSLYNAFGDKRDMFMRALVDFRGTVLDHTLTPLQSDNASIEAIGAVLSGLVDFAVTEKGRAGCMICNTSREAIRHDPAVKSEIDTYFQEIEERFLIVVREGQAKGEIKDEPPEELAALCLGAVVSISVLCKAGQPEAMLRSIAAGTIAALS